jgi:H+-translocating NAD(P) transhydrogenase subunit alpha
MRAAGDMNMKVGVAKESAQGERRVALVPESVERLRGAGATVIVERGAGEAASFPDRLYADAGAKVVSTADLYGTADVILRIHRPSTTEAALCRADQVVIGMLGPLLDPQAMAGLARRNVTAISLDAIPRTLSRVQAMDALSSQANVGGYKAVLIAANAYGRYLPLLTTPAGTARPANVLVLGVGVAGLQAIATARRLGAMVRAYDVRSTTREQVESLGAQWVTLKSVADASGEGGYARALTKEEQAAQQDELNSIIAAQDIVITTAQVPGRRPPVLVTKAAVESMKAGSVIVDMAASYLGGNCEMSKPGQTTTTPNGVEIHAPTNIPATMPTGASIFYSRNISNLLLGFIKDGKLHFDFTDEVTAATVITFGGKVVHEPTNKLLHPEAAAKPEAVAKPEKSAKPAPKPSARSTARSTPAKPASAPPAEPAPAATPARAKRGARE